jgi:hypothetical protein
MLHADHHRCAHETSTFTLANVNEVPVRLAPVKSARLVNLAL